MADEGIDFGAIADTIDKIKTRFPSYGWLLDNPEITGVLFKAIQQDWAPETFASQLKSTDWWKSTNDKQRQWQALEATNPGETSKQVNSLKGDLTKVAGSMGGGLDDATAGSLAWQALRNGWTQDEIHQAVAAHSSNVPGKESINVDKVASDYMVDLSPQSKLDYARQLNAGTLDAGSFEEQMKMQAKSRYPTIAEYIDKGIQPKQFFAPYQQMVGKMIGKPADQIDLLGDQTWQKIVSTADPKTGTLRPMTLDETTRLVRGSDQFLSSDNGKDEAAKFTTDLGRQIGAIK
jgi:hypothetical protein